MARHLLSSAGYWDAGPGEMRPARPNLKIRKGKMREMRRQGSENGNKPRPRLNVVRVVHKELKTRVTAPTMDDLSLYLEFYQGETGVKAETEEVVEDSLKEYFKGDKAFQEFKRSRGGAAPPVAAKVAAPASAATK